MIMAFLLVVIVNGEIKSTDSMLFRDINRCNFFSFAIEKGYSQDRQYLITSYCEPKMVPETTKFWD